MSHTNSQQPLIFITGGTGFLGSYILRYLVESGERVRALKRSTSRMDLVADVADRVEWVEGDVLDVSALEAAMEGVDQVYHVAAVVSFNPKEKDWMFRVNIEGTANIVNLALALGVKRVLHTSSISALGRDVDHPRLDESAKWTNSPINTNYSVSKFKSECEMWRGIEEGLEAVIANPATIIGSGYWGNGTAALFSTLANGLKFFPKGGTGLVDVRDVAQASIQLMNSAISGERFIISAEDTAWKKFFSSAAKHLNVKAPTKTVSGLPLEIFWRVEWLRSRLTQSSPLLTKETVRMSAHQFYYDTTKLEKALNFKYRSIEDSIQEIAAQYVESQQAGRDFAYLKL